MSRINGVVGGVVRPVVRGLTPNKGVGAPAGYAWLTLNGEFLTLNGERLMIRIAP